MRNAPPGADAMVRALVYLRWCSLKNGVRTRLRRLREPRYLIGGIVGLLYFYGFFFRHFFAKHGPARGRWPADGMPALGDNLPEALEVGGAFVLLIVAFVRWVFPGKRGALDFSEAEIQFLFPAPVSRRTLIHYKLLSWQIGFLFTSLVFSFATGRLWRWEGAWMSILGGWVALFLIQLHGLVASFTWSYVWGQGGARNRGRIWILLTAMTLLLATGVWGWRSLPALPQTEGWDADVWGSWMQSLGATPPLAWVLVPFRWVVRLMLARELGPFLGALLPVTLLVAAHYAWVVRANVAFEEDAVLAARLRMERLAALRQGRLGKPATVSPAERKRRARFELSPTGPAWVAVAWKNLLGAGLLVGPRFLLRLTGLLVPAVIVVANLSRGSSLSMIAGGVALLMLGISVLLGPAMFRFDFRQDLAASGEMLKVLPLPPWQVVVGELAAPWAVLTVGQWIAALIAVVFLPELPGAVLGGWVPRLIAFFSLAVLAPSLALLNLTLQNGAALLFPAWVLAAGNSGPGRGGIETMGQQIVLLAGQMVAFALALLPALLAGGVTFALLRWGFGGWGAAFPASLMTAVVLGAETALLVLGLAALWQRLDLSRERF